jgi:hypothetical protein
LFNDEIHELYSSPNIIRQIKSRVMRWVEHVPRMGGERKLYKVLVGKSEWIQLDQDRAVRGILQIQR